MYQNKGDLPVKDSPLRREIDQSTHWFQIEIHTRHLHTVLRTHVHSDSPTWKWMAWSLDAIFMPHTVRKAPNASPGRGWGEQFARGPGLESTKSSDPSCLAIYKMACTRVGVYKMMMPQDCYLMLTGA